MSILIPQELCVHRGVYLLDSRNLTVGIWDGVDGFIGIRTKFKSRFLFKEFHWDQGPPFGTAKSIRLIGMLPIDIELPEKYYESEELFEFLDQPFFREQSTLER